MPIAAFWKRIFPRYAKTPETCPAIVAWQAWSPQQIDGELAAIEHMLTIDHPVPDDAFRFLAWAIHRTYRTGFAVTAEQQLLVIDAFATLMRHRSTTLTQRLQNDRHYMATFTAAGLPVGDHEQIVVLLDQMLDGIRETWALLPPDTIIQNDGAIQALLDCLTDRAEIWRTPLHHHLQRRAPLLIDIARGGRIA